MEYMAVQKKQVWGVRKKIREHFETKYETDLKEDDLADREERKHAVGYEGC